MAPKLPAEKCCDQSLMWCTVHSLHHRVANHKFAVTTRWWTATERRLMGSSSGPTSVKVTAAAVPAGDGQCGGRVGAGLVVGALGLTVGSGKELLRDVNFAAAPTKSFEAGP